MARTGLTDMTSPSRSRATDESGFSLLEALVALLLLSTAMLGLAQVFVMGMSNVSTSSANLIAREKAREAIESVHTARDTRVLAWHEIRNDATPRMCQGVAQPTGWNSTTAGVFLEGEQAGGLLTPALTAWSTPPTTETSRSSATQVLTERQEPPTTGKNH